MLLAATLVAPGSAWAASDIGCIETRLGQAAMDRIGDRIVAAADAGASLDSALDLDREALIAARNDCRRANAWSNDATDLAVSYTKAGAARLGAERAARADGLDPANLMARYAALLPADRRSVAATITRPAIAAVRAAAGEAADPAVLTRRRRHITILYAALSAIEFYPAEFASR